MAVEPAMLALRLIYRGAPPVHWTGGPGAFGLQDKDEGLLAGQGEPGGGLAFDFAVQVRAGSSGAPVFTGRFAHGSASERFLYLGWRNASGAWVQRFKVPLGSITPDQVARAIDEGRPLVGVLDVPEQKATRTGANVGGTRAVVWQ